MSTMEQRLQARNERIRQIGGAAFDEVAARHYQIRDARTFGRACGRIFKTSQALGLHSASIARKAEQAWQDAVEAKRDELDRIVKNGAIK